jgi:hypothetical protein
VHRPQHGGPVADPGLDGSFRSFSRHGCLPDGSGPRRSAACAAAAGARRSA